MINAYPLTWPAGWPRTKQRRSARFTRKERQYTPTGHHMSSKHLTVSDGIKRCLLELERLGARDGDSIISTNVPTRLDGRPRSGEMEPQDPGVAVYWTLAGQKTPKVMAIDIYDRVADNLAAIAATLEAMRAIERHGGALVLERAFTGFTALPAPGQVVSRWRDVLGVSDSETNITVVEASYRRARSKNHPDRGGDVAVFDAVQHAWEQAQQELG